MIGQAGAKGDIHVGIEGDALGLEKAINQARKAIAKLKAQGFTDLDFLNFKKTDFKPDQFLDINEFKKQAQMFGKQVDDSFKTIKSPAKKPYIDPTLIPQKQIDEGLQNLNKVFNTMNKEAIKAQTSYDQMGKTARKNLSKISNYALKNKIAIDKMNRALHRFPAWGMSVMFLGMALQRMFTTISRFGVSAFQEVMHSVEGATTQFDYLNGAVKYLGFTIGQALEPVAAWLIPIVMAVAEWVSQNQTLARWFIVIGLVIGTILAVFGSLVLASSGLSIMFSKIGAALVFLKAQILLIWMVIKAFVVGLAAGLGAPIWAVVAVIIAVLALLFIMWKTNFGGMRDFVKTTFAIIWATIKSVFEDLWKVVVNVMKAIKAVFKGDWDEAKNYAIKAVIHLVSALVKLFVGLGAIIVNIFVFALNLVSDLFFKGLLKGSIYLVKSMVQLFVWLGGKILELLLTPLDFVVKRINAVIRAIAKFVPRVSRYLLPEPKQMVADATKSLNAVAQAGADALYGLVDKASEWATIPYISSAFVEDALENVNNLRDYMLDAHTATEQLNDALHDTVENLEDIKDAEETISQTPSLYQPVGAADRLINNIHNSNDTYYIDGAGSEDILQQLLDKVKQGQ